MDDKGGEKFIYENIINTVHEEKDKLLPWNGPPTICAVAKDTPAGMFWVAVTIWPLVVTTGFETEIPWYANAILKRRIGVR